MSDTLSEKLKLKFEELKTLGKIGDLSTLCRLAFNSEYDSNKDFSDYAICHTNKIYKHGFGGIIDNLEKIKPTFWYDKQHPFEFEFIVREQPLAHKIFDNLRIISNKAKPESFHYEIIGECYDFAPDKLTAYYRQEAKKLLYRNLGSNISYDTYSDLDVKLSPKSVSFPVYYARLGTDLNIEDSYLELKDTGKDYRNLSGTEVVRYDKLNEFRLRQHSKAVDFKDGGRLRGNMLYLEDFWNIQINPIILVEKNENWNEETNIPPLDLANSRLPNDIKDTKLVDGKLPEPYTLNDVDLTKWGDRKEIKLKDKWIKIRVRYSGKDLALISALYTMFRVSYG